MSRHAIQPTGLSPAELTPAQVERVRTALRSAAGEYVELTIEELEDRILPGFSSTN
jgi:hypothetical protein